MMVQHPEPGPPFTDLFGILLLMRDSVFFSLALEDAINMYLESIPYLFL
jgi:hypothetical protein